MARRRTGSLALRPGGWNARLSTSKGRRWVPLGTQDEQEAHTRLVQLSGMSDQLDQTMEVYADVWLRQREAAGVVMAKEEYGYWKLHCRPILGPLRLSEVRPAHVAQVLDEVVKKGLRKGTVRHVKNFLHRLFASAWRAELLNENPVDRVQLPKIREARKERVILSDEEFSIFITCDQVDEELRMLSLFSRVLGGMRAGDLHRLTWEHLDVGTFSECAIPRSKTGTPQKLGVPEMMRPLIRKWWEGQGSPAFGPVFPCRRGERKGLAKLPESSYAKRLRKGLKRAGVTRPELHKATPATLPVDFHSFRRAFCSSLAGSGVNVQRSMKLAGHTNVKTHLGYVVGVQQIPSEVVPQLSARTRNAQAQEEGTPEGTRTPDPRLRRPPGLLEIADLPDRSGTSEHLASRLVEALGDDPQLLAQVLGKLLRK